MVQTVPMKPKDNSAETSPTIPVMAKGEPDTQFLHPPQKPDEIGRLGGFRILKVLGRGGMGMVFLAEDTALDRAAAIKVMLAHVMDKAGRERFLREAKAAGALQHDNVVPVYQVGEDNEVPFLVMPLLKGETLDKRMARAALPLREALRIAREMLTGLAAAHDKGLVHRDIKPGNIFLEAPRGRARVLDFGLAQRPSDTEKLTNLGFVVGTPAYMSPEQARGKELDGRADLFSVGAVLYEMLVGRRPFLGETPTNVLASLLVDHPPSPSKLNPEVPQEATAIVMRLLAKDPNDRPKTAREVGRDILALERALVKKVEPPEPAPKPAPNTVAVEPAPPTAPARVMTPAQKMKRKAKRKRAKSRGRFLGAMGLGFGILIGISLLWLSPDKDTIPGGSLPGTGKASAGQSNDDSKSNRPLVKELKEKKGFPPPPKFPFPPPPKGPPDEENTID